MNNPSSFSSISFEAESAIKFKKTSKMLGKTHTELLNELMKKIKWEDETIWEKERRLLNIDIR